MELQTRNLYIISDHIRFVSFNYIIILCEIQAEFPIHIWDLGILSVSLLEVKRMSWMGVICQLWQLIAHRIICGFGPCHLPAAPFPPLLIPAAHARFYMVVHCFQSQLLR